MESEKYPKRVQRVWNQKTGETIGYGRNAMDSYDIARTNQLEKGFNSWASEWGYLDADGKFTKEDPEVSLSRYLENAHG